MNTKQTRTRVSLWVLVFLACVSSVLPVATANAAQITLRSLTLEANGSNGASEAGVASNHHFTFTVPTTAGIRSIQFEYCTTADPASCTAPTGLNSSSATLGANSNLGGTPTINVATPTKPFVAFTSDPAGATINVTLNGVVNPTAINETFYVAINTFTSNNATTGETDNGYVAASTAEPIDLDGTMPESLVFCTGETVPNEATAEALPDCANATSGDISFNQLFSTEDTATATSQMAASTNAGSGYVITVQGATLTSGSNTIPAAGATQTAITSPGVGQFGMNLADNTTPDVGAGIYSPTLPGGTFNATVHTNFDDADMVYFNPGVATEVANSATDVSDLQTYTVSYFVNVSGSQAAGTYTTTLTYVCTSTY